MVPTLCSSRDTILEADTRGHHPNYRARGRPRAIWDVGKVGEEVSKERSLKMPSWYLFSDYHVSPEEKTWPLSLRNLSSSRRD